MVIRLLCAVLLVLLSACAPVEPARLPPSMATASSADSGIVFGSVGASLDHGGITDWSLLFRRVGASEPGKFSYRYSGLGDTPVDFTGDRLRGSVFSARLPAGEYEVFDVDLFQNMAQMGTRTYHAGQPLSVRFKVVPGRAVYLGEFVGQREMQANIFGMRMTSGGYFVVADKMARDAAILARKGQPIDPAGVDNRTSAFIGARVAAFRSAAP